MKDTFDAPWTIDRPYRVPLRISNLSDDGGPCRGQIDFGRLLGSIGICGHIAPHSLVLVVQNAQSGEIEHIPYRASEMLFYEDHGDISWTVGRSHRDDAWWLYFDVIRENRYAPPYIANVGGGDELMLNCDCPAPVEVPLHPAPVSADWDGDGKVDMLVGSNYSNTLGMPWDGIYFFRNIGSNEQPFFDLPLRLRARGVEHELRDYRNVPVTGESGFISEYYLRFDLFDWFGTGRMDLITTGLWDGTVTVYRNTGNRDRNGLPVLELAQIIPQPEGIERNGYPGMRVFDWFGDGPPLDRK